MRALLFAWGGLCLAVCVAVPWLYLHRVLGQDGFRMLLAWASLGYGVAAAIWATRK